MRTTWYKGDKKRLAERCGVTKGHMTNILNGNRACPQALAVRIEQEARLLGIALYASDLVMPLKSTNPLIMNGGEVT